MLANIRKILEHTPANLRVSVIFFHLLLFRDIQTKKINKVQHLKETERHFFNIKLKTKKCIKIHERKHLLFSDF